MARLAFVFGLLLTNPSLLLAEASSAETIARCGDGWLEEIDGYPVLHLKGTPYEMGYQHGVLMKDSVRRNFHNLINVKGKTSLAKWGPISVTPRPLIAMVVQVQQEFVPKHFMEELQGLADGADLPLADVQVGNFIPELFHCSGFALMNSATKDGSLYHGRVLDYAVDWGLQEHAVVVVAEPEGRIPFVNVTYAGFVGSVTGMNAEHISIGEMGGRGLGHWEGVPMAFLVREALETGGNIDEAVAVFRDNPRTCEYYYVVADGRSNRAVGMEASWNRFFTVEPGEAHERLPLPVDNCVLLSAGDRYKELSRRAAAGHGRFDADSALRLMDRPVAMKSNLHNVLFHPQSGRFWVANAGADEEPAATQPYHAFSFPELLQKSPAADAKTFDVPRAAAN